MLKFVTRMSMLTVFGFGNVGQILCKQAINSGLRIAAVTDSSGAVMSQNISTGFNKEKLDELSTFKRNNKQFADWNGNDEQVLSLPDLCDQLPLESVVADCSATDQTTNHLIKCQQRGIPIAMANKKPITGCMANFQQLMTNPELIRFESTVGAGLPIIASLGRLLDSGDNIIKIQGQLSGTIGFILSELQTGKTSFSDAVRKAKACGYTEPDPRDDLSGTDVARKALILARCMGINMDLDDIQIDSLYPKEMQSLSVDEFMEKIGCLDDIMERRILNATQNQTRLRYIAKVTKDGVEVGLEEVGPYCALYGLNGTDNLVSIRTDWYLSPLVIGGPGAGVEVTAAGVLSDVYDLRGAIKKPWGTKNY